MPKVNFVRVSLHLYSRQDYARVASAWNSMMLRRGDHLKTGHDKVSGLAVNQYAMEGFLRLSFREVGNSTRRTYGKVGVFDSHRGSAFEAMLTY